jgi:hypothetical protein
MSVKIIIQTTKGIIRDQAVRRAAMLVLALSAMAMLGVGATLLNGWLLANRWIFLLYWLVCAWLTMTAALLAIFDLLAVRLLLRREARRLREETLGKNRHDGED